MASHVRILGLMHIVLSCIGVVAGLIVLAVFGGLAGAASMSQQTPNAHLAIPILGGIGGLIFLLITALSVPGLIAGIGLLHFRPWARILTIVLSAFELLNVPIGTAIGVYGLWVLLSNGSEQLFVNPPAQAVRY